MTQQLEEDIAYASGFLESWADSETNLAVKTQLVEYVKIVNDGVTHYQQKYQASQEEFAGLQARYNELVGLSSGYLALMQQQKALLDDVLIEQQRDLHKKENSDE
jgi:hypothetical protein